MRLYFVRHPEIENNTLGDMARISDVDAHRTERGHEQMQGLLRFFKDKNITKVFASSRLRCAAVAQDLRKAYGMPFELKDELTERNRGVESGDLWKEMNERLFRLPIEERYHFKPHSGESWHEMEVRVYQIIMTIVEHGRPDESYVIVTHKGCIRALMPALFHITKESHENFNVSEGSVTTLEYNNGEFTLSDFNHIEHLS